MHEEHLGDKSVVRIEKCVYDGFDVAGHRDVDSATFLVLAAGLVRCNLIQVGEGIH
jgi:hypothetical protein